MDLFKRGFKDETLDSLVNVRYFEQEGNTKLTVDHNLHNSKKNAINIDVKLVLGWETDVSLIFVNIRYVRIIFYS